MGCASSDHSKQDPDGHDISSKIDQKIDQEKLKIRHVAKLLLLGPGESGKSTMFKQMRVIYGDGFSEDSRRTFKPIICYNVIRGIKQLIDMSDIFAARGFRDISPLRGPAGGIVRELKNDTWVDSELAALIYSVWKEPTIQATWASRSYFTISESVAYFLDKVREIGTEGYLPSVDDVFRVRIKTQGIVEDEFTIDSRTICVLDAGGQRSERKKWIQVTAVLFVAAINEYDMGLEEAPDTNRLDEALYLFENIANSRWFRESHIILFLNKIDLFKAKLEASPLRDHFPDYKDKNEYEPASAWIRDQFESKNKNPTKTIFVHFTCATDTKACTMVFDAVTI